MNTDERIRARLDPEAREALAISEELYRSFGPVELGDIPRMRASYEHERRFWNAPPVAGIRTREASVAAAGIATRLRLYEPAKVESALTLVYLHGGGFTLGSIDTHDRIMRLHAARGSMRVLGVDYALAPETRFPRQIDQIDRAIERAVDHFALDAGQLAFGGDSAGAHLALAVSLARARTGGPQPRALLLYYGVYGLRDSASRRLWGTGTIGLTARKMDFYHETYLPSREALADPRFDLLSADLSEVPPSLVVAAVMDPLHDDSLALARLLEDRGRAVTFHAYDGVLHGFLHLSRRVPKALDAIDRGVAFLQDAARG